MKDSKDHIINIDNIDHIINGDSGLLNKIIQNMIDIYEIVIEEDESKILSNTINNLLLYMLKLGGSKYTDFINHFKNDEKFMKLLSRNENSELYEKLNKERTSINSGRGADKEAENLEDISDSESGSDSDTLHNKCVEINNRLSEIILNGGEINRDFALDLEYCRNNTQNKK
jgi:hypothetical protein